MSTSAPGFPLGTPIGDGLTWVNFFNGRLLTGDDLSSEQDSGYAARSQLGVAGGAGVVSGLSVMAGPSSSNATPTVQVSSGLAVNGLGKPLKVDASVELSLLPTGSGSSSETPAASPGDFGACGGEPPPPTYLTGSGVYVLVIGPAEKGKGSATVNGQLTADPAKTVGYTVDTVQFRLVAALVASDSALADPNLARNRVAYRCLGTSDSRRRAFEANPLGGTPSAYSLIDDMVSAGTLAPSEVPLATIYWTSTGGFAFIDLWSVRRRVARPNAEDPWAPVVEDHARREGEAMFMQFQEQTADPAFSSGTAATDAFDYLPPVGVIPFEASPEVFFAGLTTRGPFFVNGARVDDLIRESFTYPPISLSSPHEVIWLYEIRENKQLLGSAPGATRALLFASGHLAYRANARFDLAYFDFSNYALRVEWRRQQRR
jgi:hypothetical protein